MANSKLVIKIDGDTKNLKKALSEIAKSANQSFNKTAAAVQKSQKNIDENTEEIKKLKKALEDAGNQGKESFEEVDEGAKKAKSSSESLKNTLDGLDSVATKGLAALTAAATTVGGALAYSAKEAMNYQTSLAKVMTIADTSKLPLETLRKEVSELSDKTGIAAADLNEAVYSAISASVDSADAVAFTEKAVKLAKGGFTDTATAVDVMTTALNAYGLEASETTRISDILIATQNRGKTTVGELGSSIGRVIPTAAAFGVDMENLGAAMSILTANGIATAEATTYLNGMLNELGKDGAQASENLKAATGKSFEQLTKEGKNLGDVIALLADYAGKSGKKVSDMFGSIEAGKAALTLANKGVDEYNDNLASMTGAAGATEKAFETMEETSGASLEKIKTKFQNIAIDIGTSLLPTINDVASGISSALGSARVRNSIKDLKSSASQLVAKFGELAVQSIPKMISALTWLTKNFGTIAKSVLVFFAALKTLKTAISTINLIKGAVDILSPAFTAATGAAKALWAVMAANPALAVVGAIAALISVIGILAASSGEASEKQKALRKSIAENGDEIDEISAKMKEINDEYDSAVSASESSTASTLAEIEADKNLVSELEGLIDSNGRVKAGYEERVDYILGEMNNAYNTELGRSGEVITKNGEVVNSYSEIKSAIEANMDASMAAAIMKQYEDEYAAAVKRAADATKEADGASQKQAQAFETRKQMLADLSAEMEKNGAAAYDTAAALEALENGSYKVFDYLGRYSGDIIVNTDAWEDNEKQIKDCQKVIDEYGDAQNELARIEGLVNDSRAASAEGNNQKIIDSYALSAEELKHINEQNTSDLLADINNRKTGIENLMSQIETAVSKGDTTTAQNLRTLVQTAISNLSTLETEYKNAGGNAPTGFAEGFSEKLGTMKTAIDNGAEAAIAAYQLKAGRGPTRIVGNDSIAGFGDSFTAAVPQMHSWGAMLGFSFTAGYKESVQQRSPSRVLKKCGEYTIKGLELGITPGINMAKALGIKTGEAYKEGYKNSLDIHSPSKEMHKVGSDTTQGLLDGLDEHTREIIKLAEDTGDEELEITKFYASEKQRIEDENFDKEYAEKLKNAKDAEAAEKVKQDYIAKAQKEGQDAYLKALKAAADYEKKEYDKRVKAAEEFQKKIQKTFENLKKIFSEDDSLYQKFTVKMNDGSEMSWYELKDFTQSTEALEIYAEKLKKLRDILPANMYSEIQNMKMSEGGTLADLLLALKPDELEEYIKKWQKYHSTVDDAAYEFTQDSYTDEIVAASEKAEKVAEETGKSFVNGFISNITTLPELVAAALGRAYGGTSSQSTVNNNQTNTYNFNGSKMTVFQQRQEAMRMEQLRRARGMI